MANYQNNMRYGRMRTGCSQPWQDYNSTMVRRDSSDYTFSSAREVQNCETCNEIRRQEEYQGQESRENSLRETMAEMPLAMAYIPWQKWYNIYETCKGFHRGTIFADLDKPFLGRGGCNR